MKDDNFDIHIHNGSSSDIKPETTITEVIFTEGVLEQIKQHAASQKTREVAGILAGSFSNGRTVVSLTIPALSAKSTAVCVTITHDDWNYIHKEIRKTDSRKSVVGWYHSHPGHGIFLSKDDLFIHKNFFSGKELIAAVYDPWSDKLGVFVWEGDEPVLTSRVKIGASTDKQMEDILYLPGSDICAAPVDQTIKGN